MDFPEFELGEFPPGDPEIWLVPEPEIRPAPGPVIGAASGLEPSVARDPDAADTAP